MSYAPRNSENWLVTGSTQGIGFALTKSHLERGGNVIGSYRTAPGEGLSSLKCRFGQQLRLLHWDLREKLSHEKLLGVIDGHIDVLFCNGAVYGPKTSSLENIDYNGLKNTFDTNVLGFVRTVEAFLPHLSGAPNPRILALTSLMGTIPKAGPTSLGYRTSKAALNMAMHVIAAELAPRKITTACLRPGHVRTAMGGPNGAISAAESATALMTVADTIKFQRQPQLLNLTGEILPW